MAKVIRCKDIGVDRDFEARGETVEEILLKCAEHGWDAHGMNELPSEMIDKVRACIRDE